METKASYVAVGAFALLIVTGSLLFVLWAAKSSKGDLRTYEILFRQSVSGLSIGSGVQLEGVRIGQVSNIRVDPTDPGQVVVHVLVSADAPIRRNSQATLEPQGVTGMSVIAVTGGTADSPRLEPGGDGIARIPSRPSRLQEIMNSVPSILASMDSIAKRVEGLISGENAEVFGRFMGSLTDITETLARNRDSLGQAVAGFGNAGQSFSVAGKQTEKLLASVQTLVDKDMRDAIRSVDKAASSLNSTVGAIEPGMKRFSRDSVEELHRLLVEARRLMSQISSLAQKVESDPRRFLLGNPVPEFSAK